MKMTKTQFKLLMKECLTELINEGAFDKKLEQIAESKISGSGGSSSSFQNLNEGVRAPGDINPRILAAVNTIANAKMGDQKNIFRDILMDTAMTSLQNQLDGAQGLQESSAPSKADIAVQEAELNAISGGNPGRWAVAAFGRK